ncbi:MAG: GAF domain-containing protein [Pyrinomonadaceae bacterium]|nr:GAF domain-containing protein [Pyrinomonadaceae bacterium]
MKSLLVTSLLSLAAALVVWALWASGVLASAQAVFILPRAGTSAVAAPQTSVATLLILAAGLITGLTVERAGARRALIYIGIALLLLCLSSFLASAFFKVDVVFVPVAMAACAAGLAVQVKRLRQTDMELTRNIMCAASEVNQLEGAEAGARLISGLKLLEAVLPLDEAIIFHPDANGQLVPVARTRGKSSNGKIEADRNSTWRAGLQLCERAAESGQIVTATKDAESANRQSSVASVAVPLCHEGRALGALLLRLREAFDESDRPLLSAVGAQLARSFQRDEARKEMHGKAIATFLSRRGSARRLEAFRVVSGLLTEQRFGAEVLSETSDGQAVAYLDGTIAYLNPHMLEAARIEADEAAHVDLFTLLDRFRAGVFDEPTIAVRRVLQTGNAYERELYYPDRNQTLLLRIALCFTRRASDDAEAQPICLAITVRDVTRMKELDKLKSDMISLMSHELRTPITSINGFAELLAMDDGVPAESREFLNIIVSESQRLSRMIDTFLSVTKLEAADKQEVMKIPLKLDDVVGDMVVNLQPLAKKKRIRLVQQPNGRLPPVAADKSLITQCVANLIDNAIKYSPEKTTVSVSTELEADAVRVLVEDRGYGIPPESIDRVWEKFYRVARDGQEKDAETTGLGLSFVREVIEQHGGSVALESEVGRGSKFSFTLPRL